MSSSYNLKTEAYSSSDPVCPIVQFSFLTASSYSSLSKEFLHISPTSTNIETFKLEIKSLGEVVIYHDYRIKVCGQEDITTTYDLS